MEPTDTLQGLGKPLRELRKHFEDIAEPLRPALWRYCLRLTGSPWDAEDLVQETLARAFARLPHLWQPLEPRPYLFRIATNAWIDALRRQRLRLDRLEEALAVPDEATSADLAGTWAAMETLVALLPPRQRVVVLLTQVFDFTAREVADMLGSSEGSVKAALHRARAALQAGAAPDAPAPVRAQVAPSSPVVARYLDAFNRRDPDAICALLAEGVDSDNVGVGGELGAEYTRKYSLTDWAADPQPMWAELGELDGREVVFVYFRTPEHERALAWLITLDVAGERIAALRNYCFCPDLVRYAADRLGVPTSLYGYRFPAS